MSRTVADERGGDSEGDDPVIVSGMFMANDRILMNVDYDNNALDRNMAQRFKEQDWLPSSQVTVAVTVGHVMFDILDRVNEYYDPPFHHDSLKITIYPNLNSEEMDKKKMKSVPRLVVVFSPKDTIQVNEHKGKKARKKNKKAKAVTSADVSALTPETTLDSGDLPEAPVAPGNSPDSDDALQSSLQWLKDTVEGLKGSITALEAANTKLEHSNAELKATLDSNVVSLTKVKAVLVPIHLRFLLDAGRDKICKCLDVPWSALEAAAAARNESLKSHIDGQRTSIPLCPSLLALGLLCEPNVIRRDGNSAAHTATDNDIADAAWGQEFGMTREQLEEIYKLVYERDIDVEQFDYVA